jgi:hypothetical protein
VEWREASGLKMFACDGFGGEPSGNADRRGLAYCTEYSANNKQLTDTISECQLELISIDLEQC